MSNWIPYNTSLLGRTVDLIPLNIEHFDELIKLAKDKRIWEFYIIDGTVTEKLNTVLTDALLETINGTQFPFVVFDKKTRKIIGSTRFLDLQQKHRKMEIGFTWLHPDYWSTGVNLECKLLLLEFCFEKLRALRVQLKTDETNIRSQKAIEKIGAKFEGIFRNDMIRDNGTSRNSAYYSIIESEWAGLKPLLTAKIEHNSVTR